MNHWVERYINEVVRRLPEGERDEVRRELQSNITDMLPGEPSEEAIIAVLTGLGDPAKLAEQYRQKPRYLVSPALYDSYVSVLKPVMLIVALVAGCGAMLGEMFQFQDTGTLGMLIGRMIGTAISSAFQGVCGAAFWVTIGFAIADRQGLHRAKAWAASDLPDLPDQTDARFSRSKIIVGMALAAFFTGLMVLMIVRQWPPLIFVRSGEVIYPFAQDALYRCIPYILSLGCLSLVVSGVKLYYGRWTVPLCIVNLLHNVIWVSIVLYILRWPDLLSAEFVAFTARTFTAQFDMLSHVATGGAMLFISAALILAAVVDSAVGIWETCNTNPNH